MKKRCSIVVVVTLLAGAGSLAGRSGASDWPQWGGPHRNFVSDTRALAAAWPVEGPKKVWSRGLGEGYSGIVVEDGRVFTMYRKGEREMLTALAARDGKTLWEFAYDAPFKENVDYAPQFGPGPNATPLVAGDLVFSVGVTGALHAVKKKSGEKVWSHDLRGEFKADDTVNGYASSPIAYRDMVIVQVGGKGNSVIAFRQKDGTIVWKSGDFTNSPSSPLLIRVDGQEQLVAFMAEHVAGLNPANGALLWSFPHKTDHGLNVSTPVWGADNLLYISSAYNNGSRMLRLTQTGGTTKVEEVWYTREMRLHFGNALRIGDRVYGSSGDFGPIPFTAIDAKTGKIAWRDRALGRANMILADGRIIAMCEDGTLALANIGEDGVKVQSKFALFDGRAWTVPALAGTTLYARDRKSIVALDLK